MMRWPILYDAIAVATLVQHAQAAQEFVINNGQIFTPGFAILNSPQPETPMGGDTLHVSLDVTANGNLPLNQFDEDEPSQIFNITMFLYSYETERNFTMTNGTASANNASLGDMMLQEPGSTVKHINWVWPDCLVGDGQPDGEDSDRGIYNISIRQNFRLNGDDHYTIFDVPIAVTNSISEKRDRPSCDSLDNKLWQWEDLDTESANEVGVLFAPGSATKVDKGNFEDDDDDDSDGSKDKDESGDGLGDGKDGAGPENGLGEGAAGHPEPRWTTVLLCGAVLPMLLPNLL